MFVVCCAGSGLCDELITRSEEFNRECVCLIVSDLETSTVRGPRTDLGFCVTRKKNCKGYNGPWHDHRDRIMA